MKKQFNPWPYGIVSFFVLLFCGMATVVVIASTHRDALVNDNYYEQELRFQNQIDAAARAKNAGATMKFNSTAEKIQIALPAAQMKQNVSGKISFYRADKPALDHATAFQPNADGTESLDVANLAAGPWQVRASWTAGGQDYFLEQKIVIAAK